MNKIKSLLKGSPIAMVVAGLVIAGVVSAAAYTFFTGSTTVAVDEAIVLSIGADDDQTPYMQGGGVIPKVSIDGSGNITIAKDDDVDASEFTPGETLIIPINLRNRSDGTLPLHFTTSGVSATGLEVTFAVKDKTGWGNPISYTIGGHEGAFGSADTGATILLAKVHAPDNCPTGDKSFNVVFSRGN